MNDKQPKQNLAAEIAGWYGIAAITAAYILVSFNVVSAKGSIYQLLNLTGAAGVISISVIKKVRQTIILNLFWGGIAIIALIKLALH